MQRKFEYDEWGEHATARKLVCVKAKPHLRAYLAAVIDYARHADLAADRLNRLAVALRSPALAKLSAEYRARANRADYLLGLSE